MIRTFTLVLFFSAPVMASGVDAPELQPQLYEKTPVPFVNGKPIITPDWSAVLPFGPWNGCDGPCGEKVGVIDDEAPPVPLPWAAWLMLAGLGAMAAVKWRKA